MMLQQIEMNFMATPLPTFFLPLLNKKNYKPIGGRIIFESMELDTENGQFLRIFDGELKKYYSGYEFKLIVVNKMDKKNWFEITIHLDHSPKLIRFLQISQWKMQVYFKEKLV